MIVKTFAILTFTVAVSASGPAFAYKSQSKGTFSAASTCKEKIAAKDLGKAARKVAYRKCMEDPNGYQ